MRRAGLARYVGPDYKLVVRDAIREFLPRAGEIIERYARGRIGIYQAGWPRLAASTLRRKRRALRLPGARRKLPFERWGGVATSGTMADTPLLDTGKMAAGITHREHGNSTWVSAAFPAEVHEQDPEMAAIAESPHTPPRRAFLFPAFEHAEPRLISELEEFLALKL